jgi:hypothetical protein
MVSGRSSLDQLQIAEGDNGVILNMQTNAPFSYADACVHKRRNRSLQPRRQYEGEGGGARFLEGDI